MATVRRFLQWLDRALAPKATLDQMATLQNELDNQLKMIEANRKLIDGQGLIMSQASDANLKLRDELNAVKALMRIGGQSPALKKDPPQKFDGSEAWKR